jgi:hypothetical protein
MVRGGEAILITDRSEVIADLRQPGQGALMGTPYSQLVQYAYEGKVRLGLKNRPDLYPPVTKSFQCVSSPRSSMRNGASTESLC